ncbi:unnamed protein product [marine sediment metagenome]|uniref:Uncharacterized protein n=1 Tax=marine sediment metagenome TaxID=412755 RepID=X1TB66_9ZZZZ
MLKIGGIVVICLTALGIAAMITGNDGTLLNNIVFYMVGIGTGAITEIIERKATAK